MPSYMLYMVKHFPERGKGVVVMKKQVVRANAWLGCYSVKYLDPDDDDWQFSMDYDWRMDADPARKNQWTCAESPTGTLHWAPVRVIPDHGYRTLLDHFGLEERDIWAMNVSSRSIVRMADFVRIQLMTMSPADLVRIRRMKEGRDGLERMVIKNMRIGCLEGELADTFEARP